MKKLNLNIATGQRFCLGSFFLLFAYVFPFLLGQHPIRLLGDPEEYWD
jgi:hypothetical protein